ncbi:helix-turn-helix transcriptional regulator [Oxalobacter aliiformigenes]|nr:helix-turn-helix transcriptional regulator [Oxalobacter aliiformigenes]MCZ4065473.1 helix-turn-helix transcriptional regulator [Oxalobacter aliiformigenes]WAV99651.1 helix-turn-helix transcriptional regulator [Oxalobacter aliiformigenes]
MSKLKECRKKHGLSLQLVSDELNISVSHLSRIERGRQVPSPDLAERLSDFFHGEVSEMEILYPQRFSQ